MSSKNLGIGGESGVFVRAGDLESLIERVVERFLASVRPVNAPDDAPVLLTLAEAAKRLCCSPAKVKRLLTEGRLKRVDLGHGGSSRVLLTRESVDAYIAANVR